jgi:polar amino acid transport system substrate-binding protein
MRMDAEPSAVENGGMRRALRLLWLVAGSAAASAQTLSLHYQERPPYSQTRPDGQVTGLVADPAADALGRAGIPFIWVLTPSQRQLALIQGADSAPQCGVGWFRSDERAARGRFSAPLYRDRPLVALMRADVAPADGTSAQALLADRRLRLLVKEGYSYGPRLDRQITAGGQAPQRTSVDPPQMARMLVSGRADWMIVAPEEAQSLANPGLRMVPLLDEPDGPTRHLYCSRSVPTAWMERIDNALSTRPAPVR